MLVKELTREFKDLVTNHELLVACEGTEDGMAELELTESETRTRMMINDGFLNTYEDMRKNDPDWTTIETLRVNDGEKERNWRLFDIITMMRTRLEGEKSTLNS